MNNGDSGLDKVYSLILTVVGGIFTLGATQTLLSEFSWVTLLIVLVLAFVTYGNLRKLMRGRAE